ncbi:hypothetical protein VD0004_g9331 [Verticillium dahliae]|uniref:Alpha-glucosidase n=1 Tax=Verticillium dahliae TaxID=27337 RepID=A0A366NQP1_VERDA|nr:hypothetical protein VD0004_g9331 [Verticillium dahliae]PNH70261.1 hypothetical protein VD0001_g6946 [Verticillium dahliae]RBQ81362.1 hypothetical protein VDGD_05955 [Verticillium dahliae]RXG46510.1 hypothetical protein VDGE_05955 [Verticillium dahliae]
MGSMANNPTPWWKDATVYQIYPASFKDGNGDGLGDIPGIISKVDYLANLGVDVVWVSPMYASPQIDMGYDISDYEAVHAPYGTVEDMEKLIAACHARGMKLILDLVINHTSDQHAWFKESRASRDNPKRDWYIWRPARYDADGTRRPPTNWRSYFNGSAWQWDEHTQEYYLHLFATQQPDLNWENDAVREALHESAMRFWLRRGVDGFRVDTVNMYSKGVELRDAPVVDPNNYEQPAWCMYANGPRMHEFLRAMNTQVLDAYDAMTVGELPHTPDPAHVRRYVGAGDRQLNMVFQFDIVDLGQGAEHKYAWRPWALPDLKALVAKWQQFIDGTDAWTTVFCENHDQGRSVSRLGSDDPRWRAISAKMLALMLCSLTGTLFVYQGQEIGMTNVPADWPIDEYQDIEALNYYRALEARPGTTDAEKRYAMESINLLGRDNARIPMQWDDTPHAGFTDAGGAKPWMRVHDLYPEINVAKQEREPNSVLHFWRALLRLRKHHRDLLIHGAFAVHNDADPHTFVFSKTHGDRTAVVALNFTADDRPVTLPAVKGLRAEVGNYDDVRARDEADVAGGARVLRPWEGRLYLQ